MTSERKAPTRGGGPDNCTGRPFTIALPKALKTSRPDTLSRDQRPQISSLADRFHKAAHRTLAPIRLAAKLGLPN